MKKILIKEAAATEKTYEAHEIDKLKHNVTSAVLKLKEALVAINADEKYLQDCGQIYDHINEMPAGRNLMGTLEEDIIVKADAKDRTIDKAIEYSQKHDDTNVRLNENREERFIGELQMYIYGQDVEQAKSKLKSICYNINKKWDLNCKSRIHGQNMAYESTHPLNGILNMNENLIVERITVGQFKKNQLLKESTEKITVKDFKQKYNTL